ncbi:MAG TPA: hemerythrin domain-containing protein [Holophagaceae bacterium]|nr:hemerythrin domain-containing protein [Holophagaceae bacterium]
MTQPLIRTLRLQHLGLIRQLAELGEALDARPSEALAEMAGFEKPLLEHLSLEDGHFYPALRTLAGEDPDRQDTLAGIREDMVKLREAAEAFFARCRAASDGPALAEEFRALAERLRERMALEETQLYLAYDAIYDPDETLH